MPTAPAPGVIVNSGMSLLARLGSDSVPGSKFIAHGGEEATGANNYFFTGTFEKKVIQSFPVIEETSPPSAASGAYEIKTGNDFSMPNNTYLVGLAKVNHRGQVAPVASVR